MNPLVAQSALHTNFDYLISEATQEEIQEASVMATAATPDTFIRKEEKFLFPKNKMDALLSIIHEHMSLDRFSVGLDYTEIRSTYFDSPLFEFYNDHFLTRVRRNKIRTRQYYPEGRPMYGDMAFLEVKSKVLGMIDKKRFTIGGPELARVFQSRKIKMTPELEELNIGIEPDRLKKRLRLFNALQEVYDLVPQVMVSYHRTAYENESCRVTIDQNLSFKNLADTAPEILEEVRQREFWQMSCQMGDRFSNDRLAIVEIKFPSGGVPEWFADFMNKHNVEKTSFSKYCWSITQKISNNNSSNRLYA